MWYILHNFIPSEENASHFLSRISRAKKRFVFNIFSSFPPAGNRTPEKPKQMGLDGGLGSFRCDRDLPKMREVETFSLQAFSCAQLIGKILSFSFLFFVSIFYYEDFFSHGPSDGTEKFHFSRANKKAQFSFHSSKHSFLLPRASISHFCNCLIL